MSSELEVGDTVIATDPRTGLTAARAVTAVHVNLDTALADVIVIDDDGDVSVIHTTQHHPFWNVSADSWSDVVDLDSGDQLRSPDGSSLTVLAVRSFADEQWMWNLTVADIHTFYVANGDEPILVHNCLENQFPDELADELDRAAAVGARPIRAGAEGFDDVLNAGEIKYAVLQDGTLVITPYSVGGVEISHAVLSAGAPVLVAGHANVAGSAGDYWALTLNNQSGHFGNGDLDVARRAFAEVGVIYDG